MRLRIAAAFAPPNAPVSLDIDVADAQLSIPGLRSMLHALPTIELVFDQSTAAGVLPEASLSSPYVASLVGLALVTQLLAIDIRQPGIPASRHLGRGVEQSTGDVHGRPRRSRSGVRVRCSPQAGLRRHAALRRRCRDAARHLIDRQRHRESRRRGDAGSRDGKLAVSDRTLRP
ncbi:MAG: hypothetical protein IPM29_11590 [Planctomycetes bacterium]|nr:hypothetical protein [Planctomycetota bacterium]